MERYAIEFSSEGNYSNYRKKIAVAKLPAIPFFNLHFQEIYISLLVSPDTLNEGVFDLTKYFEANSLFNSSLKKFKQIFLFHTVHQVQVFLNKWENLLSDTDMAKNFDIV